LRVIAPPGGFAGRSGENRRRMAVPPGPVPFTLDERIAKVGFARFFFCAIQRLAKLTDK
jgi:hypothetical protein